MGAYGSPELNYNNIPSYDKNMIFCSKCGVRYSKKLGKCPQCGKKCPRPIYNKWWFWCFVVFVVLFLYANLNPVSEMPSTPSSEINEQPSMSKEEYIDKCEEISYTDVARTPNAHIGKYAVFTGKVIQIQENGNYIMLRVNVSEGKYGLWEDTIYIDYQRKSNNENRILENDIVTIYGKMNGIKTYETVLGNQVSIPHLLAEYIEIN